MPPPTQARRGDGRPTPAAPRQACPGTGDLALARQAPDAGLSLVEMLVALALFALIGMAGFAMLDAVARVQTGTDGRLARLAELDRALHLVTLDFEQLAGELTVQGGAVAFARPGGIAVRYDLADGALRRRVTAPGLPRADQRLIEGVADLAWRYLDPARGWVADWPPPPPIIGLAPLPTLGLAPLPTLGLAPLPTLGLAPLPTLGLAPLPGAAAAPGPVPPPRAIALDLGLSGPPPAGRLTRVVRLPGAVP